VKKLIVVATKVDGGKGGISSALNGYLNGFKEKNIEYQLVESHRSKGIIAAWLTSFWQILLLSIKHRNGDAVFWFHCGPWLSAIRKFSLAIIPRLCGCKTLGHIHSPTFNDYLTKSKVSQCLTKLSISPYTHLIMLTPWWKSLIRENGISKKAVVSPNPNSDEYCEIAKKYLKSNKSLVKNQKSFTVLSMARLVEGKGVELVIKAISKLPNNYKLKIAGEGPLKESLVQLAQSSSVSDRVEFLGWIDGEKKKALLSEADLFCLPSTYDSFGMVFIEAMAFDLPVIAYGWGPISDVVTPDVGICCSKPCADQVKTAIVDICTDLSVYSGNGPQRVLENYTSKAACHNIIELLK